MNLATKQDIRKLYCHKVRASLENSIFDVRVKTENKPKINLAFFFGSPTNQLERGNLLIADPKQFHNRKITYKQFPTFSL